jgi:hypothetical protein
MVTAKKPPAKTATKAPFKAPAKVAPVKRSTPKPKPEAKPAPPKNQNTADKVIDLIKWVDNPFKLFTVILLSFLFFAGYFAWDSRQVILGAITNSSHKSALREVPVLEKIAQEVMRDLDARTVVVHRASLVTNGRTTLLAIGPKGRTTEFDGYNSTLFNKDPVRNTAMIAMMNGEVYCTKREVSGKTSEWESKQGVEFTCWASIPPEIGQFEGYASVGFDKEPNDLTVVKTRLNLASTEMAK